MCEEELCYEYLLIDATIQANVLKQEENDPKNQDWVQYPRLCMMGISDQIMCKGALIYFNVVLSDCLNQSYLQL